MLVLSQFCGRLNRVNYSRRTEDDSALEINMNVSASETYEDLSISDSSDAQPAERSANGDDFEHFENFESTLDSSGTIFVIKHYLSEYVRRSIGLWNHTLSSKIKPKFYTKSYHVVISLIAEMQLHLFSVNNRY